MTDDATTPAPDPAVPTPDPALDVDAERERLAEAEEQDERILAKAEDDLEVGGSGRTFSDEGVTRQVEEHGDTDHPTGEA